MPAGTLACSVTALLARATGRLTASRHRHALHHLPDFWKVVTAPGVVHASTWRVFRLWDVVYSFDVDDAHQRISQQGDVLRAVRRCYREGRSSSRSKE